MSCSVLFDVDGTLVDSVGFEDRLFIAAIREILGPVRIRVDWGDYPHVTDSGVLSEICRENGLKTDCEPRVREHFGQRLAAYLQDAGPCLAVRGALACFEGLRQRRDVGVAIATGGWSHSARMKLDSAGFDLGNVPLASSDQAPERVSIMQCARAQLPASARTVYVGDREWDLAASQALGWEFVGVGPALRGRCARWMADYSTVDSLHLLLGD